MTSNKWTSGENFFEVDTEGTAADMQSLGINRDAVYDTQVVEGDAVPRFRQSVTQPKRRATEPGVMNFLAGDDD